MQEGTSPIVSHADSGASTYATAHGTYRTAGWTGPLPLPAGAKWPPPDGFTGWHGTFPSYADSQAWIDDYSEYRNTPQLGLRMAEDIIGIDVDHYGIKRGLDTLAEAEKRWGPLPPAPISTARQGGSGIRFYRIPKGAVLRTRIVFPELNLGAIEIIQFHHRYALAWPSIHPDTGDPYGWLHTRGPDVPPEVAKLHALPQNWLYGLLSNGEPGEAAADPQTVNDFHRDHTTHDRTASVKGVLAVFNKDVAAGSSRHDAMVSAACMAAREARAGAYSADDARTLLRDAFIHALAAAKPGQRLAGPQESRREFDNIWAWAVSQALALSVEDCRARIKPRETFLPPSDAAAADSQGDADDTGTQLGRLNLPVEFWAARPALKDIYNAALSRWACPDAVLGAVLARLSAYAAPATTVDLGIGPSPITLFCIGYGRPSAGKGLAVRTAADLLPTPQYLHEKFRERPLGSGEGVTESYMGMKPDPTDDKGKRKIRAQIRDNILFVMDEGEGLIRMAGRNGSTITTVLRRAWSGELLGEANASADRDRQIERGAYSIGLSISFQPDTIAGLFDPNEVGGGTPHRFLYFAADNDALPEEPPEDSPWVWPGPLDVRPEHDPGLRRQWDPSTPRSFVLADEDVKREVRMVRWRGLRRGHADADQLDGHMMQMCGRVAAHLALLDARTDINGEDWRLAGQVVEISNRVRDEAKAYGERIEAAKARRQDERKVALEVAAHTAKTAVDEKRTDERISRGGAVLARKVLKDGAVDGLAKGKLREAAGRYKKDIDDCLAHAVEAEWLVAEELVGANGVPGTRYRVGPRIADVPPGKGAS